MNYTPAQIARLISDVYSGTATPQDIPEDLYFAIADHLKKALYEGFGGAVADFSGKPEELLNELRTNVYMFSAAKSYQQMREYTDLLHDENGLRSFKDFKVDALAKYQQYNVDWLATERGTAIASGQQGYLWNKIEEEKELFPFLKFTAVLDKSTTPECKHLDGIVAPVGHPVWNTCYPPNHWNCRSTVLQVDQPSLRSTNAAIERARVHSEEEMQDVFKMNVGKDKWVYSPEHPYFQVAPKDRALAHRNFDLPIPPPVRSVAAVEEGKFVPGKSIEEVQERILKAGVGSVDLVGLKLEMANGVLDAIESEAKFAPLNLEKLKLFKSKGGAAGLYYPSTKEIRINVTLFNNFKTVETKSFEEFIIKEKKYREKVVEKYVGNPKYNQPQVNKVLYKIDKSINEAQRKINDGEKFVPYTVSSMANNPSERIKGVTIHEIGHSRDYTHKGNFEKWKWDSNNVPSKYAETNRREYFAEWYAQFRTYGEKSVPEDLLKLFKSFENEK